MNRQREEEFFKKIIIKISSFDLKKRKKNSLLVYLLGHIQEKLFISIIYTKNNNENQMKLRFELTEK